jgi:ribosomal protein S19E (S16A)
LEGLGVVSKDKKSELKRLSRRVTSDGTKDMDRIADQVAKAKRATSASA